MYQTSYNEVLEDDPKEIRDQERAAFTRIIDLLDAAEQAGPVSRQAAEAMLYTRRLWMLLLEDLASDRNDLPEALRAELISIGIWVTKELDRVRLGQAKSFKGIRDICVIIRDGLN